MKPGQFGDDMLGTFGIGDHQLLHFGLDQIGLHRFMMGTHDADRKGACYGGVSLNAKVPIFL